MKMRIHRVWPALVIAAVATCGYEHAPRSGPLAALADSLFPPGVRQECRREIPPLPDSLPAARMCKRAGSPNWVDLGRSGRILSVVINWADDTAGIVKASNDSAFFSNATGREVSRGEADASAKEYHWRTDTLCYSLYHAFDHHGYQEDWYLPERFGHCM